MLELNAPRFEYDEVVIGYLVPLFRVPSSPSAIAELKLVELARV